MKKNIVSLWYVEKVSLNLTFDILPKDNDISLFKILYLAISTDLYSLVLIEWIQQMMSHLKWEIISKREKKKNVKKHLIWDSETRSMAINFPEETQIIHKYLEILIRTKPQTMAMDHICKCRPSMQILITVAPKKMLVNINGFDYCHVTSLFCFVNFTFCYCINLSQTETYSIGQTLFKKFSPWFLYFLFRRELEIF